MNKLHNYPNLIRRLEVAALATIVALGGAACTSSGAPSNGETTAASAGATPGGGTEPTAMSSIEVPQSDITQLGTYENDYTTDGENYDIDPNSKTCNLLDGDAVDYNSLLVALSKTYPGQENNLWYEGTLLPGSPLPLARC